MGWSYTKVTSHEGCPFAWSQRYVHGKKQDFGMAAQRGSNMHDELEHKLPKESDSAEVVRDLPTWMVPHLPHLVPLADDEREQRVFINSKWEENHPFNDGAYWHISVIDLFKNNGDGSGKVVDYKSGKRRDSHDAQIELYGAVKLCTTNLEQIEAFCYYLDEKPGSTSQPIYITRDSLPRIKQGWQERVDIMEADTTFEPRPNYGCRWCSFARDKGGDCVFSSHEGS